MPSALRTIAAAPKQPKMMIMLFMNPAIQSQNVVSYLSDCWKRLQTYDLETNTQLADGGPSVTPDLPSCGAEPLFGGAPGSAEGMFSMIFLPMLMRGSV